MFGIGFGPKEIDYLSGLELLEICSLPKRPSKDTNHFYKKAMRNSSELAESRRLPTACFGLVRKQQTESYATQVVDSYPKVEDCGAQATQQTKRKLNPFVEECEASATQKIVSKGVMPPERTRGLTLAKPLSLEQFVALMMSPPNLVGSIHFIKLRLIQPSRVLTQNHSNHMNPCATTHLSVYPLVTR